MAFGAIGGTVSELRIKACLNGARTGADHLAVPLSPAELAYEAALAVAAGAQALHIHPRRTDGTQTLLPGEVGAAVRAVRSACPDIPVGVSTGLWITGGAEAVRTATIATWAALQPDQRPDFASVNLSEPGTAGVLAALEAAGIAAEAGVWSVADARAAAVTTPAGGWLRILVEIIGVPGAAATDAADEILTELDRLGMKAPRLLHGENDSCWPLVRYAGRLGLATRIGLEDTLADPDGEPVSGNDELVTKALAFLAG